jgi:L-seryl-tRNA(Ser) seleniumtransferase
MRVGKLTLAALSATLEAYLRGMAEDEIPVLALLQTSPETLRTRAEAICGQLTNEQFERVGGREETAPVGGGSLPGAVLPTAVVAVKPRGMTAEQFAHLLRVGDQRVVSRVQNDEVILDLKSVTEEQDSGIVSAVKQVAQAAQESP